MLKSDKVRIQYASKYASSANYWKNAIGMNEGLVQLKVLDTKKKQQEKLLAYGRETGTDAYQKAFDAIREIVNNAGIRRDNLMLWMEQEEWSRVLDISLNGFFNVTQPLLKNMLVKRFGRIINIVSLSGIKGMPGQTNYSAAKGGIIAATKALAQEVAKKHVTVNAIAPGFIRTDMTDGIDENEWKKHIPVGRFGEPGEVAALVGFLASGQASYITGEVISINGGLYT